MSTAIESQGAGRSGASPSRVESRSTVSSPDKVIQVEQVRVSEQHKSAVASAIRFGKAESH